MTRGEYPRYASFERLLINNCKLLAIDLQHILRIQWYSVSPLELDGVSCIFLDDLLPLLKKSRVLLVCVNSRGNSL